MVENMDTNEPSGKSGDETAKAEPEKKTDVLTLEDLREQCRTIELAESTREPWHVARVLRSLQSTRKRLNIKLLGRLIQVCYGNGTQQAVAKKFLQHLLESPAEESMDVDQTLPPPQSTPKSKKTAAMTPVLPEIDTFIHLLTTIYLVDRGELEKARICAHAMLERLSAHNRRSLDILAARGFYYYCLIYEKLGRFGECRDVLHSRLRTATLRHDYESQAMLICCLLRLYLHEHQFQVADKMRSKLTFPDQASNNLWARYFYYIGRVEAMQLQYPQALQHLHQALRKAPQQSGAGFKQAAQKLLVVVQLLQGEIPERPLFRQPIFRKSLQPYFQLTQAVRIGDIQKFNEVVAAYCATFEQDGTHSLIIRLRQNVIRTAVRQIASAYSRISLDDVQRKLQLEKVDDAEYIVGKAIQEGVIEGRLDHASGWLETQQVDDLYATKEPQQQFHSRIAFCLQLHNQSVKAMRFPPKVKDNDLEDAAKRLEREKEQEELAKEMAEQEEEEGF